MTTIKISRNMLMGTLLRLRHTFDKRFVLPILNSYYFVIKAKRLIVHVTDAYYTNTMEALILADDAVNFDDDFCQRFCVDRRDILPVLKTLSEQELTFNIGEYQMTVIHDCGKFTIPIRDGSEYPHPKHDYDHLAAGSPNYHLQLEAPGLARWIGMLYHAMAQDELRPAMSGILVDGTPEGTTFVASDGHRLLCVRKESLKLEQPFRFIIPRKVADIIKKVLPKTGNVDFYFGGVEADNTVARLCITLDDDRPLFIYFKGVDGRYPNYLSVIPNHYDLLFSVDRMCMIRSLDRLRMFAPKLSELVRLNISELAHDRLAMTANYADFDISAEESIPIEVSEDRAPSKRWGMKAGSLAKCLKVLSTQSVVFKYQDCTRAIIIEPSPQPDVEDITCLLMPMMCND